ncbi:hypothetical protein EEW87_000270 [Janibacter melonis]|uniref:CHAT domain-containing protein n=1 Tax=Janibacter melonis TaxID=262209 RepID=A0A5P8FHZ1_9MICO|nr:hypothetical protein [Janibacter melonis]QFQ29086.1 hypothetical protein EEW87_000270 [Janibacter melonis]
MATNGIYCLEGEWDADLRKRQSVQPVLQMLESLGMIKFIHRDVATREELEHYLARWERSTYDDYQVLYLATHGDRSTISWSSHNSMTLDGLADALGDTAQGCYVYLGGCSVLASEEDASRFVRKTGAAALCGYRKDVDWIEGAAFELIMLDALANHTGRPKTLFISLMKRHSQLAALYEFVLVTKAEVFSSKK